MTNTPAPHDPIAQLVAKYQSNGHQTAPTEPRLQPKQKKGWTGFAEKTLWDWLNLLGVFLIPIVITAASIWFSAQQNGTSLQLSDKQHQSDQAIALDQQRATTLKTYMDDMTQLLGIDDLLWAHEQYLPLRSPPFSLLVPNSFIFAHIVSPCNMCFY